MAEEYVCNGGVRVYNSGRWPGKETIFQEQGKTVQSEKRKFSFGLTLVNKMVKSFNGKIWVEDKVFSDPSKGSNFIILIPIILEEAGILNK